MPEPQSLIDLAKEICSYTVHAFGKGSMTTSTDPGTQYGTSGVSTSTDTWKVIETKNIAPWGLNSSQASGRRTNDLDILEVEFVLTAGLKHTSTTATAKVTYAWQAQSVYVNSTENWVWLTPTSSGLTMAPGGSSWETDASLSGYFTTTTYFDKVPMTVRLLMLSGGGSTSGDSATGAYARPKSSSYVKVLYRVT